MARARGALVALSLLSLLPTAGACSWASPPTHDRIFWLDDGALATQDGYRAGLLAENGSFEPVVGTFPANSWAVSADGRWFASAYGAREDQPQGGLHGYSTCWQPLGVTEVVDLDHGSRARLLDGAAHALAAGPDALAVAHATGLYLFTWGDWTGPRRLDVVDADRTARIVWSPDGARFARSLYDGRVQVFDAASGRVVDEHAASTGSPPVRAMAFSPDGTALAILASVGWEDAFVDVLENGTARRVLSVNETAEDIAWGPRGLAVSTTANGDPAPTGVVRLLVEPRVERRLDGEAVAGLAWSPGGDELAVGTTRRVLVLDDDLQDVRERVTNVTDAEPRFAPVDLDVERGPPRNEAPAWGALATALALGLAARRRRAD